MVRDEVEAQNEYEYKIPCDIQNDPRFSHSLGVPCERAVQHVRKPGEKGYREYEKVIGFDAEKIREKSNQGKTDQAYDIRAYEMKTRIQEIRYWPQKIISPLGFGIRRSSKVSSDYFFRKKNGQKKITRDCGQSENSYRERHSLNLCFFMRRSFFAPPAEFAKLQFPLNCLLVFRGIIVIAFADGALKFY